MFTIHHSFIFLLLVTLLPSVSTRPTNTSKPLRGRKFRQLHTLSTIGRLGSPHAARALSSTIVKDRNGTQIPPYDIVYYFDQLIDHSDPSKGTFKQRYWHTWEYYVSGGPIYLSTPGEVNAEDFTSYLTNQKIQGAMAEATNGATIVLEHRFFGLSYPYNRPLLKNLVVHTIGQAMEDLAYFAQNVKLPMPGGSDELIRPNKTPWVLIGGSYAGALVSWTMEHKPGLFWAGYTSSGVVQPIADFWQYFEPIRQNMPQNCSTDVELVVQYVDKIVASGDAKAIDKIKKKFSLEDVYSTADFLLFMHAPLLEWQALDVETTTASGFFRFCDALEVRYGKVAPPSGFGLSNALEAWGKYFASSSLVSEYTEGEDEGPTVAAPANVVYSGATWDWMVCNELGWILRGPPLNQPAISMRSYTLMDKDISCRQDFPGVFDNSTLASRVSAMAATYIKPNAVTDRLFVVNGKRDPWLFATLSSPDLSTANSTLRPVFLTDGFHCSDLTMRDSDSAGCATIANVQQTAIETMKTWVSQYADANTDASALEPPNSSSGSNISSTQPAATATVTASPSPSGQSSSGNGVKSSHVVYLSSSLAVMLSILVAATSTVCW